MAFPTNLKDEIKADGVTAKQYVEIDVTSGASLNGGKPIVLKRYDKPKQQGSVLNATMVNAIHKRFNDLEDGTSLANTAKYANSLTGYSTIRLFKASGYAYSISADASLAYLNWQVGAQFAGCMAIATPQCISGTPYRGIYSVATGTVSNDGYLQIEITGTGFITAHIFALSVLVFKQI